MRERTPSARREHLDIANEAGLGRLSPVSIVAGTVCAYGTFAVLAAVVGSLFDAAGSETDFSTNDWVSAGAGGAMATAIVLCVAYLFGGYVTGRMARRAGWLNGLAVFALGLVAAAAVGGLVAAIADDADVERNLRSIGVPTTSGQWGDVGVVAAILGVTLMLVGAAAGGFLGERWHTKLARRAADPTIGPEADARAAAVTAGAERERRLERDGAVGRDVTAHRRAEAVEEGRDADRQGHLAETSAAEEPGTGGDRADEPRSATLAAREDRPIDLAELDRADRTGRGRGRSRGRRSDAGATRWEPGDADGGAEPRYTRAEWEALDQTDARR